MERKYRYDDWWDGKICLNTSVIVTEKDDPPPIIVGWDCIIAIDHARIKNKGSVALTSVDLQNT
jgi:hypothetical protein